MILQQCLTRFQARDDGQQVRGSSVIYVHFHLSWVEANGVEKEEKEEGVLLGEAE